MSRFKINKPQLPHVNSALPTYNEAVGGNYEIGFKSQVQPPLVSDLQTNKIFRKQKLVCRNADDERYNQKDSEFVQEDHSFGTSECTSSQKNLENAERFENHLGENNHPEEQDDYLGQYQQSHNTDKNLEDSLRNLQEGTRNLPEPEASANTTRLKVIKSKPSRPLPKIPHRDSIQKTNDEKQVPVDRVQYFLDLLDPRDKSFDKAREILETFTAEDWMTLSRRLETSDLW